MFNNDKQQLAELRKTVRDFLKSIQNVPMRAVDCDQDKVTRLLEKLMKMSNFR